MKLVQILLGNVDEARNQLKRLVSKSIRVTHAFVAKTLGSPCSLKFVAVKAYGMETHVLLDTGAVPNPTHGIFQIPLMGFCKKLELAPTATDLQVTVADWTIADVVGCVEEVAVCCILLFPPLNLLVLWIAPLDSTIGSPKLESLHAKLG